MLSPNCGRHSNRFLVARVLVARLLAARTFGAWLLVAFAFPLLAVAQSVSPQSASGNLATEGSIVLFRHAMAPGVGDPENFQLGNCSTQRNLSAAGRAQAKALGDRMRAAGVAVTQVLSSHWCRTLETAELAFPGQARSEVLFDSFFTDQRRADPQTDKARALLLKWRGPGVLVVVTHQVNITQLTDVYSSSGEGVIVRPESGELAVVGRIAP